MNLSRRAAQQNLAEKTDLEKDKSVRQEESRLAVMSGATSLDENFFIPREVARTLKYTFKP